MGFVSEDTNFLGSNGSQCSVINNSVNPAKIGSYSFLYKLFSRRPSMPKLVTAGLGGHVVYPLLDNPEDSSDNGSEIMPCPYIRPLGSRLEPRVENVLLTSRRLLEDSATSMLHKRDEPSRAKFCFLALGKAEREPLSSLSASDLMNLQSLRLRENIAAAAAADSRHLKDWGYYMKCYSEGRYSLTVPPGPPPINSDFTYLPSIYPPNEIERLETFRLSQRWSGTDIEWSGLEAERARQLIKAATLKFGTPWGSISFFDHDTEIIQAERGYSRHFIPRRESIASHALLTDEAMVVLDAQKDWRFIGNPLVTGRPKIRFFAGAPLLSVNGRAIGVFAIFSPGPRSSFNPMQRRDLMGFSELAARDLTIRRDLPSRSCDQSSPTLQQDSRNKSATISSRPPSAQSPSKAKHRGSSSFALRYHKELQNGKSRSRVFIKPESRDLPRKNLQYMPPNSDDSDARPPPILAELQGYGKELSLAAPSTTSLDDIGTPDSPTLGEFPPNPSTVQPNALSMSNLNSIYHQPGPRTQDVYYMNDDNNSPTEYRRDSVTIPSNDATILLTPSSNSAIEVISETSLGSVDPEADFGEILHENFLKERGLESASEGEVGEPPSVDFNNRQTPCRENLALGSSFPADLKPGEAHGVANLLAEARFAAELWAKNLGFDTIYAIELFPKRLSMSGSKALGGVETRILVSYGLDESIDFDIPIHLNVLRGSGATIWQNDNGTSKEYGIGFMMPLLFGSDMLDCRSSGVVFGAFRKTSVGINGGPNIKTAEIERLRQAADVLREILSKSLPQMPSHRELDPQSYPANEAIEVGGSSRC